MFKASTRGFSIEFDNGYKVSVMFGEMNYCENRYISQEDLDHAGQNSSDDAEVQITDTKGDWHIPDGVAFDGAIGWQTPTQVAEWLAYASNLQKQS